MSNDSPVLLNVADGWQLPPRAMLRRPDADSRNADKDENFFSFYRQHPLLPRYFSRTLTSLPNIIAFPQVSALSPGVRSRAVGVLAAETSPVVGQRGFPNV